MARSSHVPSSIGTSSWRNSRRSKRKALLANVTLAGMYTVYIVTKDNQWYRRLAFFGLGVDFLQMLAFLLSPSIFWGDDVVPFQLSYREYIALDPGVMPTSIATVVLIAALLSVWTMVSLAATVGRQMQQSQGVAFSLPAVRLLRILAALMLTVFFLPVMKLLLSVLPCDDGKWLLFPSHECYETMHAVTAAITIPTLLVLGPFAVAVGALVFQVAPTTSTLLARPHNRIDVLYICGRMLITLVAVTSREPLAVVPVFLLVTVPVFSLLYISPPFYRHWPCVARIATFSALSLAAFWTLINLVIVQLRDDSSIGSFAGFWVALVIGGAAGAVAGHFRYMRLAYAMIGGLGNGQEGSPVDALPDIDVRMLRSGFGSAEILTRFLQTHHKRWHVRRANAIFLAEIQKRPKSARLRAMYVIFLMHYAMGGALDNPFELAHKQMDEAKHLFALPDTSYILFTIRRGLAELQQGVVHGTANRGDLTTLDHAFLRKQERRAQLHANSASEWISRFWVAIALDHANDAVLRTIAVKIDENEKEALDAYEMLLRRFPSSVRVTRSFGAFLDNIANDKEGAEWAFSRAEQLEEALASKNRKLMESKMSGHKDRESRAGDEMKGKNLDVPGTAGRRLSGEILPGLVETPAPIVTPSKKPSGSSSQYTAPSSMVSDGNGTTDLFLELNNDQRQLSLGQLAPSTRLLMSSLRCVVCYFLFFIIPSMCLVSVLGFARIESGMDNGLLDVRSGLISSVVGDTWRLEKATFGHDPLIDANPTTLSQAEFEALLIDAKSRADELDVVNRKQRLAESAYVNHGSIHLDRILLQSFSFVEGEEIVVESDMWSVFEEIQRQASIVIDDVARSNNISFSESDAVYNWDFVSSQDAFLDVMFNALRGPLMQTTVIARQIFREQLDKKASDLFLPMVLTPAVHCIFLILLLVWVIVAWIRVRRETRVIGLCRTIPADVAEAELNALHSLDQASKLDEAGALFDVDEDDAPNSSREATPKKVTASSYYDGALRRVVRDANLSAKVVDEKAAVLLFIVVSATTVIILLGLAVLTKHPEFRTATHAEVMRQRVSLLDRIASDLVVPEGPLLEVSRMSTLPNGETVTQTSATTSVLGNRTATAAEFVYQRDILAAQLDILLRGRSKDDENDDVIASNPPVRNDTAVYFADANTVVVVKDSIPSLFDDDRQIEWLDSVGGASELRNWMDLLARVPITKDPVALRKLYFHIDFPTKIRQFEELVLLLEGQAKDRFSLLTTMAQSALFPCLFIALAMLYVVFVHRLPRKLLREVRLARRLMDLVPDTYSGDVRLEQIFAFVKGQHVVLRHTQSRQDDNITLEQGFKLMAENNLRNRSMPGRHGTMSDSVIIPTPVLESLIHTARSGSQAPPLRPPSDAGSARTGRTGGYNIAAFSEPNTPAARRTRTMSHSSLSSSLMLQQGHCTVDQYGVLVASDDRGDLLLRNVPGYGIGKIFPGWPGERRGQFSFSIPGGPTIATNLEATVRETGSAPHLFLVSVSPPMPSPGRRRVHSTTTSSLMRSSGMTRISEGDSVDEMDCVLVFDIASLDIHFADRDAAALCGRASIDQCNLDELFAPPPSTGRQDTGWSESVTRLFSAQQHGMNMSPLVVAVRGTVPERRLLLEVVHGNHSAKNFAARLMTQQPSLEVVTVHLRVAEPMHTSLSPLVLSPAASPLTRSSLNQFNQSQSESSNAESSSEELTPSQKRAQRNRHASSDFG